MTDLTHLNALEIRLSHERGYLAKEESTLCRKGVALRQIWVKQIQKEIAAEKKFLGIEEQAPVMMSDDELLAELMA